MNRTHVCPVNDVREHDTSDGCMCPCMPLEKPALGEDDAPRADSLLVLHMSYDGREIGEVCRKALDRIGCALADHGHQWTSEECFAYEHAIHILEMHYPCKDGGGGPAVTDWTSKT